MPKSKEELLERAMIDGWKAISSDSDLTEEFIEEYLHKLDLDDIFVNHAISYDFIDRNWDLFKNEIDFLFGFSAINQNIVEKHISDFSSEQWKKIGIHVKNLSEEFIREHEDKLDMEKVFVYQKLSQNFMKDIFVQEKYKQYWSAMLSCQMKNLLKNDFIFNYVDKIFSDYNTSWSFMIYYFDIPENIIEKCIKIFIKSIESIENTGLIRGILCAQNLSEEFIKKYKKYLDWDYVLRHQKLSENFICEMENYINFDSLKKNKKIQPDSFYGKLGCSVLVL